MIDAPGIRTAIVCGGRKFRDFGSISAHLGRLVREYRIRRIVHGAALGADSLAERWAVENFIRTVPCPADWNKFGRGAGPVRNQEMLTRFKPDLVVVIAFPGGVGTADMVNRAVKAGITVINIPRNPPQVKAAPTAKPVLSRRAAMVLG